MTFAARIGLFVIILFTIAVKSHGIDYSLYAPSTINAEFKKILEDHNPKDDEIIIHPHVMFSIESDYLQKDRDLSEESKRGVEVFSKAFVRPEVVDVYKREILVRDSDGREYWLPIQESFMEYLRKEYCGGCTVTLYLIMSVIDHKKPLVLINEFSVK